MSPSNTRRKVDGNMELDKKLAVIQANNNHSLGFHGLGQPAAARGNIETGQMSSVETRQMSVAVICPLSAADICPVSTEDIYPVSTEDLTAAGRRPAAVSSSAETG